MNGKIDAVLQRVPFHWSTEAVGQVHGDRSKASLPSLASLIEIKLYNTCVMSLYNSTSMRLTIYSIELYPYLLASSATSTCSWMGRTSTDHEPWKMSFSMESRSIVVFTTRNLHERVPLHSDQVWRSLGAVRGCIRCCSSPPIRLSSLEATVVPCSWCVGTPPFQRRTTAYVG